jgi:hypothetical protein
VSIGIFSLSSGTRLGGLAGGATDAALPFRTNSLHR